MRHLRSLASVESISSVNSFGSTNAVRPVIAALYTKHKKNMRCILYGRCSCHTCPSERHAARAPLMRFLSSVLRTPSKLMI
eukprot:208669-Pyramimonas_sp.AAC.1